MKLIEKDKLIFSYSKLHPAVSAVGLGETFRIETHERFSKVENSDKIPGLTGPVFIKGIKAGHVLKIDILNISLTEDFGVIISMPDRGVFGSRYNKNIVSVYSLDNGFVNFSETIKVPLHPHLGRIVVAPSEGEYPTGTLGPFGGNMDNTHICPGASVYLPVFIDGALLSMGDIHACMGDGESNLSGVETSGIVTIKCSVANNLNIQYPLIENEYEIMTTADGETFEEAAKYALHEMANILCSRLGLSFFKAAELISIAANLRVCQIVNPRIGVKVLISKKIVGNILG